MAPKKDHTRANQERPPATPVTDLEKIIRKGRALQRKISRVVRTPRSDLLVEGEESLALLLGKIYKDFYFPDPSKFNKSPIGRTWLIEDEEADFKIRVRVH